MEAQAEQKAAARTADAVARAAAAAGPALEAARLRGVRQPLQSVMTTNTTLPRTSSRPGWITDVPALPAPRVPEVSAVRGPAPRCVHAKHSRTAGPFSVARLVMDPAFP